MLNVLFLTCGVACCLRKHLGDTIAQLQHSDRAVFRSFEARRGNCLGDLLHHRPIAPLSEYGPHRTARSERPSSVNDWQSNQGVAAPQPLVTLTLTVVTLIITLCSLLSLSQVVFACCCVLLIRLWQCPHSPLTQSAAEIGIIIS